MDAFYAWVTRNTEFPDGSDGGEITAEVVLSKDGKINDVRILNSSAPELDRVVKKTLLQSSKWKPGRSNGKPVNYRFVIPFRFQL
jgi:protein TonB